MSQKHPWFVRRDLDGFFGLMIDNLIQLILIVSLCREVIHIPDSYIFGRILPGAAVSILLGNLFYSWQARQLSISSFAVDALDIRGWAY
jgi:AGZA family xanthine/uracil permease-like MFS transporter